MSSTKSTTTQRRLARLHSHLKLTINQTTSPTSPTPPTKKKLLAGIRVIELATVIAAPSACALLCDLGAEVIKIENPKSPDVARLWGYGDDAALTADTKLQSAPGGGGSAFSQINRGKKSIALNPTDPKGNALLLQLIATADIFVTNVRQKSLIKMGIDYETLSKRYPKLIYGHLSAWGRSGPMASDPGYDYGAFWAHTGVQDILRSSDDAAMPRFPGGVGDFTTGHQLYGGIMAALYQREREGVGQLVDAALVRAGIWFLSHAISQGAGGQRWAIAPSGGPVNTTGGVRETTELGQRRTGLTDAVFKCKDQRWIQLMGLEQERHMPATLKALGLTRTDVFLSGDRSDRDWKQATSIVDKVFLTKTTDEWAPILTKNNVWWKKVNTFREMMNDEQVNAAGSFVDVPGVRHKLIGNPVIMSAADHIPNRGAPKFGQHTKEIFSNLGVTEQELIDLKRSGVVTWDEVTGTSRKK